MKHLKLTIYSLITLFVAITIVSCSTDSEVIEEESTSTNLDSYLKSFYSNEYRKGKKINLIPQNLYGTKNRTAQVDDYTITEVFVGNEDKARGYLFENSQTNEIENFVDVDRINYKLTSVDLDNFEVEVQNAINQIPEYQLTDEFDIIKIIEDPIINDPVTGDPQVVAQGWRYSYGSCRNGFRGVYRAWYAFGIRFTKWKPVLQESGASEYVGCNEEYEG